MKMLPIRKRICLCMTSWHQQEQATSALTSSPCREHTAPMSTSDSLSTLSSFDCVRITIKRRLDSQCKFVTGFILHDEEKKRTYVATALHALGWRPEPRFIIENHSQIIQYYGEATFHPSTQTDSLKSTSCWPPQHPPAHIDTGYRTYGESSRGDIALFLIHTSSSSLPLLPALSNSNTFGVLLPGSVVHMVTIDKISSLRTEYCCEITSFDTENRLWRTKLLKRGVNPSRYSGSPVFDSHEGKCLLGIALQGNDAGEDEVAEMFFAPIEDIREFLRHLEDRETKKKDDNTL